MSELTRFWPFIDGRALSQGVDLRELFERLDGERTLNLIDALLIDDAVYGSVFESDGLEKMRVKIMRLYRPKQTARRELNPEVENPSLYSGKVLHEDDSGFFGLQEAPLG